MNTLPVKESIGLDEVHRVMQKDITSRSMEQKLWYNLKYDKEILMPIEIAVDIRMRFKGNPKH